MWLRNYQRLKQGQELDLSWRAAARANGDLRGLARFVGSLKRSQQTESKKASKATASSRPEIARQKGFGTSRPLS
jgi:hypothetical protein